MNYDSPVSVRNVGLGLILDGADVTVTATATAIKPTTPASGCYRLLIQNTGAKSCTLTNNAVPSATNGVVLMANQNLEVWLDRCPVAICASGETTTVRIAQLGA